MVIDHRALKYGEKRQIYHFNCRRSQDCMILSTFVFLKIFALPNVWICLKPKEKEPVESLRLMVRDLERRETADCLTRERKCKSFLIIKTFRKTLGNWPFFEYWTEILKKKK